MGKDNRVRADRHDPLPFFPFHFDGDARRIGDLHRRVFREWELGLGQAAVRGPDDKAREQAVEIAELVAAKLRAERERIARLEQCPGAVRRQPPDAVRQVSHGRADVCDPGRIRQNTRPAGQVPRLKRDCRAVVS